VVLFFKERKMAILKAKVTITGTRSILFHRFSEDSIPLEKKELTGVPGNDPQEWKRSVLMTHDRQLFLEPTYIFGCLRDGGKLLKAPKGGNFRAKVAATLMVLDETILLDRYVPKEADLTSDKTAPVYIDVRSVKNPGTKGRNIRYRIAASPGWKATFEIQWESTLVYRDQMISIARDAGQLVGLGDGRSLGFGRFIVENFEVSELER